MTFFEAGHWIHFIGVGGIGVSGLARLAHLRGATVSGSDMNASPLTLALNELGAQITIGHDSSQLYLHSDAGPDLVVYSEAIPDSNVELKEAREKGMKCLNYFEALGDLSSQYRLIAIAGTHGKTTTTSMLALILIEAGMDPTVSVGSTLPEMDGMNARLGTSDLLLVEACEYRRNFLPLKPELLGVLNMELDHVDYFKDEADYMSAFKELSEQSEEVIWPEDYVEYEGELFLPGAHNRMNAGMAAQLARRLGIAQHAIAAVLKKFKGAGRRFEFKGEFNGADLFDDYAHHPSEIEATLEGLRERYPEEEVIVVFQPHQFSRVRQFLEGFKGAFGEADHVIIPNIYGARDSKEDREKVSAASLVEAIAEHHDSVVDGGGLEKTAQWLSDNLEEGQVLIVMGAGNVGEIFSMLV